MSSDEQAVSLEGWVDQMYMLQRTSVGSGVAILFYVSLVIVGSLFIMQVRPMISPVSRVHLHSACISRVSRVHLACICRMHALPFACGLPCPRRAGRSLTQVPPLPSPPAEDALNR